MKVALIGRTNVGKSSLFNRLIGQNKAIISPVAGTTRDRNTGTCSWLGMQFELIDTGGLDIERASIIEENVILQAELAIEQANLVLVVVDSQTAPQTEEREMIRDLKKKKKPFLLVANKADSPALREKVEEEFNSLGGKIFSVSAVNGTGTGDLLDEVVKRLVQLPSFKVETQLNPKLLTRVTIIGRPNVGKSSLLNAVLGREQVIVSNIPHTTREPQDTLINHKDNLVLLIDTAGIRKKARVERGIEKESVMKTLSTLKTAHVAVLVLEANGPVLSQDKHLASEIVRMGVSLVVVFNKWDLLPAAERDPDIFREKLLYDLPFIRWAPLLFVSAKNKRNVTEILDLALELRKERERTVDDDTLDKFLKALIRHHKPHAASGPKAPRLIGLRQLDVHPPYFELVADYRQIVPDAYIRFIENGLRDKFGFRGTPIKISVRGLKSK